MPRPIVLRLLVVGASAAAAATLSGAQPAPAPAARTAPAAATAPRAFRPSDVYRLTAVAAPALSPDGRRVAFTVTTVREGENRYHSEVWVGPVDGSAPPRRWTSPGVESSNPRWSPDGSWLWFQSSRPGGEKETSAWRLRADAPGGEAEPVGGPLPTSWSRDGRVRVWGDTAKAAAVPDSARRTEDPYAKAPAMARPPHGAITRPLDPARFDGRHVVELPYKSNDRGYLPNRRDARRWNPRQIVVQVGDEPPRAITTGGWSARAVEVSPDGRWVAFVADSRLRTDSAVQAEADSLGRLPYDARRDEAERDESDVFVIPIGGGTPRRVTASGGNETDLSWAPDSRRLAVTVRPGRTKSLRLHVVDALAPAPAAPRELLGSFRYEPESVQWLPDGVIAMSAAVGGRTALFRVDPGNGAIREVLGGRRRLSGFAFDRAGRQVAYVATSMTQPRELYVAGADGRGERRLTRFHDALAREVAMQDAERFTYPSVGGLEIEGWLMKPYGYVPGRKYPLVLYIHGGPHSAYGENWFDEFQNLAGAGMFVLFTNPRGSSGYGADFTYASRGRWFAEDYQDLMKAVDLASARPDVDTTRLGVSGGSYGGVMTAWITAKTQRFRAAQADRMISDWTYWYGASDAQGLTEFEFYGKPWDNFAMYDSLSPIRQVARVKTPTLIVQSEEDFRTPMGNAELWFTALSKRGVPVELVRYPRSTHELSRSGEPWLLVDRLGRLRQWFGHWLQPAAVTAGR
ncbi:MAG TPA: S9 family peptidase [Gemmatirosa sp.]|nr:S9 family peptidase [Gemmatirosa sp.]